MSFLGLLREHPRLMGFGVLFCFGSSIGQTFFISLFVPSLAAAYAISEASIANIYALVTLAGAATLIWAGRIIDRTDLLAYAAGVCAFLAAGCFLIAGSWGVLPLAIGLGFVRLGGQGLMSHIALTGIARHFNARRGAALALVTLGFPLGEILLPYATVWSIDGIGWRATYVVAGVAITLLVLPLAIWLLRGADAFRRPGTEGGGDQVSASGPGRSVGTMRARDLWRSPYVLALAPAWCASPFAVTALIFHQAMIADGKGLTLALFAASFALFGVVQIAAGLLSGPLIDRFGARTLLPLHLIPFGVGVVVLALNDAAWAAPVYLGLLGASGGLSATLRTAVIAELVRPAELGAARSGLTALMVFATALGPAVYGWMMLARLDVNGLLWATLAILAAVSALAALAQYGPWRKPA